MWIKPNEYHPNEKDINFIVSKEDFENEDLKNYFKLLSKYNIVKIDYQTTGPGGAVLKSKLLETNSTSLADTYNASSKPGQLSLKNT